MESVSEETRIKFIKALDEMDNFCITVDQSGISTGKLDPDKYGDKLEAVFRQAIIDMQIIQ